MSKKLGEILIDRGAITAEQLEAALRNQLMLGGHLGSCLLELAFVDEEKLGDALAAVTGAPCADLKALHDVDPDILESVPKRLVEEYKAVPFRRNDRVLDVAMINPGDLLAIDAFAFASGCKIVPSVAPEARILEAMERLYGIPRRTRYIVLSRTLTPLNAAVARDAEKRERPPDAGPAPSLGPEPPALGGSEPGLEYGYGRSWVEIAEELSARSSPLQAPKGDTACGELAAQLCAAESKDAIARAVLAHALKTMKRAVLFVVQGDEIVLWRGAGFETELDASEFGAVEMRGLTLLDRLLGNDHYHGPLGDTNAHREVYLRLGVPPPVEILLAPVHVNDRLMALFLGDGGPRGRVEADPRDTLRVVRMLGVALNILILKKTVRNLGSFTELPSR